ncbi:MAG: preprotein translocase subunit SecG [Mycoplasmataceae bacterium]|nr:preprotein translocase subunit SecG [Mycoplasmataceae bacterium]
MIETILMVILLVISIFLIFIGFLMSPDSNSFSGALVGSSDLELFSVSKEKGYKKFLKWSMVVSGFLLIGVVIIVRIYVNIDA